MSSFYQILLGVGGGITMLAALIKAGPIVWKSMKGWAAWADVQHDVARAITETLPLVEKGHIVLLDETKALRGDLADHVALESSSIKLILDSQKTTADKVSRLETAGTAQAHTEKIIEAVTEVRDEQLKQNGGNGPPAKG